MRVLLIHPVHVERGAGPQPFRFINIMPVGLFSLADVLDRAGHQVEICHLGLRDVLAPGFSLGRHVASLAPDLVGISLHWHPQLAEALDAAVQVRAARPGVRIVLGGITASLLGEELLNTAPEIDFVIRGDGERPLLQLCEYLDGRRAVEDCANLLWRDERGAVRVSAELWAAEESDLGAWFRPELMPDAAQYRPPYYAMPDDPPEAYTRTDVFYLVAHRGCPHSCDYCGGCCGAQKLLRGGKFTRFSVERMLAGARHALESGRDRIYLLADNSVLGDEIFIELAAGLADGPRPRELHLDVYRLLEPATLKAVRRALPDIAIVAHVTPEAGSDAFRARRRPPELYFTNPELEAYLRAADRAGVSNVVYCSLHPAAPEAEVEALGRLARDTLAKPGRRVCLSVLDLDLHSPWAAAPAKHGLEQPIRGLAQYLELDRRRSREGTRYPRDLGYAYPQLHEHLRLLQREIALTDLDNHEFLTYACGL